MAQHRTPPPRVLGVISGCGGAGGSVLAALLAAGAAAENVGPVVLLDCDPLGGGIDVLLRREQQAGVRWSDVRTRGGTIDPVTLLRLLPRWQGVSFLAADTPAPPDLDAVRAVIDAARQVGRVVIDLPRWPSSFRAASLSACGAVVLVTPAQVRAVTASAAVATGLIPERSAVAVRGATRGLPAARVGALLGLPVAGRVPVDPVLAGRAEWTFGMLRRTTRDGVRQLLSPLTSAGAAA